MMRQNTMGAGWSATRAATLLAIGLHAPALAQSAPGAGGADLSQALQNPLANVINVPFQDNFDFNGGRRGDGFSYTLNFQPVIPVRLSNDWTLITRTIVPIVHSERIAPQHETGLGDVTQSFLFSRRSGVQGLTVGAGPVFLWPTATRPAFQSRQWAAGPTGVVVRQSGPWTFGALANHLWGYADAGSRQGRPAVNQSFVQPFVSRNFAGGFALSTTLEASYDWDGRKWTLPLGVGASQLVNVGGRPINLAVQARHWLDGPSTAPEWGLRFTATLVFR